MEASYFIKCDSIIFCILSEGTRNTALGVAGAGIYQRRTSKRTLIARPVEQHLGTLSVDGHGNWRASTFSNLKILTLLRFCMSGIRVKSDNY